VDTVNKGDRINVGAELAQEGIKVIICFDVGLLGSILLKVI